MSIGKARCMLHVRGHMWLCARLTSILRAPAQPRLPVQQKVDRRPESAGAVGTKRERCVGVEAYWRQLEPHQRRQIMRAPLGKMVEGGRPPAHRALGYKAGSVLLRLALYAKHVSHSAALHACYPISCPLQL